MEQVFHYRAANRYGEIVQGIICAMSASELDRRLSAIGMDLLSWRAKQHGTRAGAPGGGRRRNELAQLFLQLESLAGTDVPILDSLAELRDSTPRAWTRRVLAVMYEQVSSGEPLSVAMGHHPRLFDGILVALVSAGETVGDLTAAFRHCAAHLLWVDGALSRLMKAVRYPAVLVVITMAVMIFLLTYFLPNVITIIEMVGGKPDPMLYKLRAFVFAAEKDWQTIAEVAGSIVGTFLVLELSSKRFATFIDRCVINLPLLGPLFLGQAMTRLGHFLSIMLGSGVEVRQALAVSIAMIRNRHVSQRLSSASGFIEQGASLSAALAATGVFPKFGERFLRTGEATNRVSAALSQLSDHFARQVERQIDRLTAYIEPALILMLGGVLIWLVVSLLLPLYDQLSKVKF